MFAAALLVALFVGSRGITDEGAVSVQGDMPRYLMDGVFLYDFLGSGVGWTFGSAMTYAQHYFAQYPALSIGHHPPLLPISLVPFYAIFGVSVFAARLAILAFFVLSVVLLYTLVDRVYDEEVAGWACLLFASSPMIARFAQRVLSEMPTIALVLGALNALVRFRDSGRLRDYLLFVVLAVASLASRQLAVFMWPAYIALLVTQGGWSRLAAARCHHRYAGGRPSRRSHRDRDAQALTLQRRRRARRLQRGSVRAQPSGVARPNLSCATPACARIGDGGRARDGARPSRPPNHAGRVLDAVGSGRARC